MNRVRWVAEKQAGNSLLFLHLTVAPSQCNYLSFQHLFLSCRPPWDSHSGFYGHVRARSLLALTRHDVHMSPHSRHPFPRGTWPRVAVVCRGLNRVAPLCGSERPPLNCDIYCFTFPFFHLNGRIVHLFPPALCPCFVLF